MHFPRPKTPRSERAVWVRADRVGRPAPVDEAAARLFRTRPERHRQEHADEVGLPVRIGFAEQVLEVEHHRRLCDLQLLGDLIEALALDQQQSHPRLGRGQVVEADQGIARDLGALLGVDDEKNHILGVRLSRQELAILEQMMRRFGRIVPKAVLEEKLYGIDEEPDSNPIPVHVHHLRRQLETASANVEIHTIRGVGYILADRAA